MISPIATIHRKKYYLFDPTVVNLTSCCCCLTNK
jgi:hypothetical protein